MHMRRVFACALLLALAVAPARAQLELQPALPNLTFQQMTDLQAAPGGTDRLFVVEQPGRIRVVANDPSASTKPTFLDIRARVASSGNEQGLLGLAFHPDYATNGRFFVNYTRTQGGQLQTVIARFTVAAGTPDQADPASEVILLAVDQPLANHNAGQIQFGSDGFLYVALGDGGGGGDPRENGQDPTTLLGSLLRLDVDATDRGAYGIPAGNPFVGDAAIPDETYAYGFRNPYRFSFGPDGRLWLADVGQNAWEEVDIVKPGQNYGWNTMEGPACYDPAANCDQTGLTLPDHAYEHNTPAGGRSVTGGYVYTGTQPNCDSLQGAYLYGDFISGNLWALTVDPATEAKTNTLLIQNSGYNFSTFGVDADDRFLAADRSSGVVLTLDCTTLPVELTAFTATPTDDDAGVTLAWRTLSETNNAGFAVEQRAPGADAFAQVAYVEGAGTTTAPQTYRLRLRALAPGRHAFRLRQLDFDGTATPSPVVETTVRLGAPAHLAAYPNPARAAATVALTVREAQPAVTVAVFDVLGRRVATLHDGPVTPQAPLRLTLDAAALASGAYLVRATGPRFTTTTRLTLVR